MKKDRYFIVFIVLLILLCFIVMIVFNPSINRKKLFLNFKKDKFTFIKGHEIDIDDLILEKSEDENISFIIPNIDSYNIGINKYLFVLANGLDILKKEIKIEIIDNIFDKEESNSKESVKQEKDIYKNDEDTFIRKESLVIEDEKAYINGVKNIEIKIDSSLEDLVYLLSKDIVSNKDFEINYEEVNLSSVGKYLVYYKTEELVLECLVSVIP